MRQDFELRTTKAWTISSQTLSGEFVGYSGSLGVTRDESVSKTSILSTFPVRYVPFNRSSSSPEQH